MLTELYALVPEERLKSVLETLQAFTELPLRLIDPAGNTLYHFGGSTAYCALLKTHLFKRNECDRIHMKAGQHASMLGEAYIFTCHAALNHIAFPLMDQGELLGSVIVGPFLMDDPDSTLVSELMERYPLSPTLSLELYDRLVELSILSPARVQILKKLMEHLLSPLLPAERTRLLQTQEKMYQQARVNETIQLYKEQNISPSRQFFYDKESELLTKVRTGNMQEAKALLNELIGHVLFSEGGRIETVRMHAIELTTLLSRIAMDGGARTDSIYTLNSHFLTLMTQEQNVDELCYLLQDMVERFMNAMFSEKDKGNPYIRQALRYIADNYDQPLTLTMVAEKIGLSPSYFSTLFHTIVGVSFREHLCRVRVEESKRLLLSSRYSLTDIAMAVGFTDQSYYCKVFRRIMGLPPGRFRGQIDKEGSKL